MQKWDYKWMNASDDAFYGDRCKAYCNNTMNGFEYLRYLGSLGWELVSVTSGDEHNSRHIYLIKKPIE